MKNLKVLDLKNNYLECNDDFRNLMKFLGTRKVRTTRKIVDGQVIVTFILINCLGQSWKPQRTQ